MRIKLLAAAAATVLLVATAAVILSCKDGTTAPTPERASPMDDEEYFVEGYCYDTSMTKTNGITCRIYDETCADYIYTEHTSGTFGQGYYICVPAPPDYSIHNGCTVHAEGFDMFGTWGESESDVLVDGGNWLDIYEYE